MAAGKWTLVNSAPLRLFDDTFDLNSDDYKVALFKSNSNIGVTSTTYANLTNEVDNSNGYATGGVTVDFLVTTSKSGSVTTVKITFSDNPMWEANGGPITARFAVIYEVGGNIVAYVLLDTTPQDVSVPDGGMYSITSPATGVLAVKYTEGG